MSPQMPHGKTHCLRMQPPTSERRSATCKAQSLGSSLTSHDTSPSSVAAMSGRHCSLIHTIPVPQLRSAVCRGHFNSHDSSPTSAAVMGRGHPLIHMLPAPHQRQPCVEDSALSLIQGDMGPLRCKGVTSSPCAKKRAKVRSHLMALRGKRA